MTLPTHVYVTQVPPVVILSGPLTDGAASQSSGHLQGNRSNTAAVTCTGSSLGCGSTTPMPSGSDEFGSFTAMTFACSCAGVDIHYIVRAYQQTIGAGGMRFV